MPCTAPHVISEVQFFCSPPIRPIPSPTYLARRLAISPGSCACLRNGRLDVWQVNAEKQFRGFLDRHKEKLLSILEGGSIFSRSDIEPLLDTTLPGMAEMAALLAISDALASGKYDHIVVDTAPIGHTLRLFALPQYFSSFLDILDLAASRDRLLAQHFGGAVKPATNPLVEEWRAMVEAVSAALLSQAEIFLVTTPEKFSLNESRRSVRWRCVRSRLIWISRPSS